MKNHKFQYFIENMVMHLLFIVLALMISFYLSIIFLILWAFFIYRVYRYFEKLKKDGKWYVANSNVP